MVTPPAPGRFVLSNAIDCYSRKVKRLWKNIQRGLVTFLFTFIVIVGFSDSATAQQSNSSSGSTPNRTPGVTNKLPGNVNPAILNTGFTATATFDGKDTNANANSVDFTWKHPKATIPTHLRSISAGTGGASTFQEDDATITYRIQRASKISLTNQFKGNTTNFCNSRGTSWQNLTEPVNQTVKPGGGAQTFSVVSHGARDGNLENYYRLVIAIRSQGASDPVIVRFAGTPANTGLVSSPRDEYIIACTDKPITAGDSVNTDGTSYTLRATLDQEDGTTIDDTKTITASYVIKNQSTSAVLKSPDINCASPQTPVTCAVMYKGVPKGQLVAFEFSYKGKSVSTQLAQDGTTKFVVARFFSDGQGPKVSTFGRLAQGTQSTAENANDPTNCNKYISVGIFGAGKEFSIGKFLQCQLLNGTVALVGFVTNTIASLVTTNPWDTIRNSANGVENTWRVLLGLVDLIVIAGLLAVSFSNIFRFLPIKLDQYQIKQALPGIIWGIILANLSFFALRLMIETASIGTQALASLVAGQIGRTAELGNQSGTAYLISEAWNQFGQSLINTPPTWLGGAVKNPNDGLAALGIVGNTILEAPISIIGLVALLIFMIVAIIFFLVLLFLLFIRNYVIVVLFILSPLAFFALCFPPLKTYWQKWWEAFWKWLLMLPTTFAVLAFAIIVLSGRNAGAVANGGSQNAFDYFFFNGVGLALIYFAIQVPFMWGKLFGYDAMSEWRKNAPAIAGKVAKTGIDYAGLGVSKFREKGITIRGKTYGQADPLKGLTGPARFTKLVNDFGADSPRLNIKDPITGATRPETDAEYGRRLDAQARKKMQGDIHSSWRKNNPMRIMPGLKQVYDAYKTGVEKEDEIITKQGKLREWAMKSFSKYNYLTEQTEKNMKDFEDYEDPNALLDQARAGVKILTDAGMSDADAARLLYKAANAKDTAKFLLTEPAFPTTDKMTKAIAAAKRYSKVEAMSRGRASTNRDRTIDAFRTGTIPYSKGGGPGGGPYSKGGSLPPNINPVDYNQISKIVQDGLFQATAISVKTPGKAVAQAATIAVANADLHVNALASSAGIMDKKSIDYMLLQSRKLGLKSGGGPLLAGADYYGLSAAQYQTMRPSLELHAKAVRGTKQVAQSTIEDEGPMASVQIFAKKFSEPTFDAVKKDQLDNIVKTVKSKVRTLAPNSTLDRAELLEIHTKLADTLGTLPPSKDINISDLQLNLQSRVREIEHAQTLVADSRADGISIEDAALRRRMEDLTLSQMGKDLQGMGPATKETLHRVLAVNPYTQDTEARITALVNIDPVLHVEASTAGMDADQIKQLTKNLTEYVGKQIVEKRAADEVVEATDFVNEPSNADQLRKWLRGEMKRLAETGSQPAMPAEQKTGQSETQSVPVESQAEVQSVESQVQAPQIEPTEESMPVTPETVATESPAPPSPPASEPK